MECTEVESTPEITLEGLASEKEIANEWEDYSMPVAGLIPKWLKFDIVCSNGPKTGKPTRGYKALLDLIELHNNAGGYTIEAEYYQKKGEQWVRGIISKQGVTA